MKAKMININDINTFNCQIEEYNDQCCALVDWAYRPVDPLFNLNDEAKMFFNHAKKLRNLYYTLNSELGELKKKCGNDNLENLKFWCISNEDKSIIAFENKEFMQYYQNYKRKKQRKRVILAVTIVFGVINLGMTYLNRKAISHFVTHTAIPTIAKLGAGKVLGGLGIGLLGWHVAVAGVGAALLMYGLYKLCQKRAENNSQNLAGAPGAERANIATSVTGSM